MTALRCVAMTMLAMTLTPLALAQGIPAGTTQHIRSTLIAESNTPAAGNTVALAIASVPETGWHGYWENPGDAGFPTRYGWTLPKGVTASAPRYPVPQKLVISGLMNHVYEGPFAPLVTLTIPAGLAKGRKLPVSVRLDYLVCTDTICVPESAVVSTVLTVGDGAVDPVRRGQFDGWRRALPKPIGIPARFAVAGDVLRIAIPLPAAAAIIDPHFFALTPDALVYAAPQRIVRDGDTLVIETKANGGKPPPVIEGVLAIGPANGLSIRADPGAVAMPAGQPVATPVESGGWTALLIAFGGAVLGGLLLNIMPCVFPILSLKALSLAKAGATAQGARRDALAYAAGVVIVCVALGSILLVLRAGGASVGWAFQLQDPRVIVVLLLLVTAIALNLAGLFEVGAPRFINRIASDGAGGSFATGALAAFVATPCSGPFMGAALGAALVLPWAAALAVFAGLGLGIALPFLAIGFVPALRRRLPGPGQWMATLRHILSVPMFATALALAWVLGRQAGVEGMTTGLAAAMLVSLGLWWTGVRQARGRVLAWFPAAAALAIAAVFAASVETRASKPVVAESGDTMAFTEARLAVLRAQGRQVFVYFTADWCVTCKVNEKVAIETQAVEAAFARGKVAVLVGDWTDGDPELGRFITQHNRAGVPLTLWYPAGGGEPRVLPQVLTPTMLTGLVEGR